MTQVDLDPVITVPTAPPALEERTGGGGSRSRHRRTRPSRIPSALLSHGGWSLVVATTGVSGLNFIFHLLISRLLGPSQYGAFSAVLNIISVLAVPLSAVQLAATQAVISGASNGRASLRSLTIKAACWGVGAMIVTEALSPLTDSFLSLNSPFANLAMAAWIPLAVVGAVLQGALLGEMRFVPVAVATFVGGGVLRLITGAVLVSAGFGVAGAVTATVIGQAFTTGVLLLIARREVFTRAHNPVRISLRDTVLSIGALAGCTTQGGIDVFLARHYLPHVAAGLYAAGSTAGHIAMFLPGALVTVAFPRLVAAGRSGTGVRKTLTETLGLVTAIGLVAFAVLAAVPGVVVGLLFGRTYADAAGIVGIIGFTSVLLGIISVLTYFYVARRSVAALSSWAGVALVIVLVAVLHGGMETVAVCMLVGSGAVLALMSVPALAAVARSASRSAVLADDALELPPAELDLSLVIPFYNPGSRLASHVQDVTRVLRDAEISFEVIAVSDGSTDGSPALIAGIGQVRVVHLPENQGKGAALRVGLAQGRGRYLGFIDADGDIPAAQLNHFLAATRTGDPDVVLGTKRHPDSEVVYPPVRRLYSFGYQQLNRMLFQLPTRDTQTGIKLIRRETLGAVLPKMVEKRFAFDLELLVVARRMGYCNFVELPVRITERFTSTISLKAVRGMLLDTFAIFYRLRISRYYGPQRVLLASLTQMPPAVSDLGAASKAAPEPAPGPQTAARQLADNRPADSGSGVPLRILAYNWRDLAHPRAGGAEVYLQSVAREWIQNGHQVTLFCGAVEGQPAEEIVDGVRIIRRGGRVGVYREAKRYWQREGAAQYDLVLDCVNTRPFLCPRFVKDVPVVALIHQVAREVWHYETPWPISILGRYLLEPSWLRAYRDVPVVTVSESSSESLAEYGLRRITVVPEGWVPAESSAVEKEAVPTVVFVGRLSANKRPEHAIRTFDLARRELRDAQMWVIGKGPEEARLRKLAGPGVTFFGHLPEQEKRERVGRAHALVTTSVREGWGLVVTEAAASGTVAIGYDVAGLRDSIGASGGVLTQPHPKPLAKGLVKLVSSVAEGNGPQARPAGVIPWSEVAANIVTVMRASGPGATQVPERRRVPDRPASPRPSQTAGGGGRHAANSDGLPRLRASLAVLGAGLLLIGGSRVTVLSPVIVGTAFLAFVLAILAGVIESLPSGSARKRRLLAAAQSAAGDGSAGASRIGLAIVVLVGIAAGGSWFQPGTLLAGGDMSPVLGTAWLRELFTPWLWSGSNLGGPAANETKVPFAAVYLLVQALGGSSACCEEIWYIGLFVGAAVAGYFLLRALGIGPAGSVIGALAYVFNAHVVDIATNPVFLAAMVLLPALPAVVLRVATGRRSLRWGTILLAASAPLLGYVSQNAPLVLVIVVLVTLMPLLAWWLDGRAVARRAWRVLGFGTPLCTLASAYWIVPTVLQLKLVASATLANTSSWTWTEVRATLVNGFWLNNDWGWRFAEYYPYAGAYAKFPLQVLIFILPAAAFGFLALARFYGAGLQAARRARLGAAAAAGALFLVLLSMGTRFPGSVVFDPLYALPLGWLLREPGRFLMLGGLVYAVLFGLTAEAASEWLKPRLDNLRRWRSPRTGPALRLAAIGGLVAAALAPGFPLITGAVVPSNRPVLPSMHVSVPAYWTEAASYLNGSTAPGNVLLLPEDDFYQMPYSWGYYGADDFITDLIARNVVDPISQGYTPAAQELTNTVQLVQRGLLAHDWVTVQRMLAAMGTSEVLVRGDIDATFPGRHITPPAELEQALQQDKGMRLVRRFGKLELFALRAGIDPSGMTTQYVTVNSAEPDLRDLSLFPAGTVLLKGPMRSAVPAVLQVPPVSQWRIVGNKLQTSISEPAGWNYSTRLLSATGALTPPRAGHSRTKARPRVKDGHTKASPSMTDGQTPGKVTEQLSYALGGSVLKGGGFTATEPGAASNCDAVPGTSARLSVNVLPGQGPAGQSALSLSANADSACVSSPLDWRSGPLFVSLWVRHVAGAAPRMCLFELPADRCAALAPLPSNSGPSKWSRYQTIVTPTSGTKKVSIYLYADVYTAGSSTTNEYSDVVVRKFHPGPQPVVVATPQRHEQLEPLYATDESYSSGWTVPSGAARVEVDGLRNGWLGASEDDTPRFSAASWYQMSRVASLVAVGLLLALGLSGWAGRRFRRAAALRTLSKKTGR